MVKQRTDVALRRWIALVVRRPSQIAGISLLVTVLMCGGIGLLEVETSIESFLPRYDPARLEYDAFRREFGGDDTTILTLYAPQVFDGEFVKRLVALHRDLERNLPYTEAVTSLLNARVTYGLGDRLVVEDLLHGWPLAEASLEAVRVRAAGYPAYRNALISEDGHYASMSIDIVAHLEVAAPELLDGSPHMLSSEEREHFVSALSAIVRRHASPEFPVWVTGREPIASAVLRAIRGDMVRFSVAALVLIATVLLLLFRRTSGVVLPLATVVLTLLATFGVMGWMGVSISPTTQILPSFLLAVGVCDAIHVLAIYYRRLDGGRPHGEALADAYGHSGFAIVMTSITTAVCLASFLPAAMPPVSGLGFAAVAGVALALFYTLSLMPAVMTLVPMRPRAVSGQGSSGAYVDRALVAQAKLGTQRPGLLVVVWSLGTAVALYGAVSLHFEHKPLEWFRPADPTRVAIELINDKVHAGGSYAVILDTGKDNGLYEPGVMRRIDAMREFVETVEIAGFRAGRAISIVDVLKETHRALNGNDPDYFTIPDDRELIAQELLLFELSGSDDIDTLVDANYRKAHMTLLVPIVDGFDQQNYMEHIERRLRSIAGSEIGVEVTGYSHIGARTATAMVRSTVRSYAIALLALTPLMILMTGSMRRGLLSMIPNIVPIIMLLGLMYALGIPLDVFSTLIGSIAIGVAADDTIHLLHNFARYSAAGYDPEAAVRESMMSVGRALLVTSLALVCGFLVFTRAVMINVVDFGIITSFTVAVAFLADTTLTPALLVLACEHAPVVAGEPSSGS